jgi:selenide,water dikinase
VLDAVLGRLTRQPNPNLLVGFDKADDAAVYRLDENTALVQTVDFFTPIVDDPHTFGQIAAANSLSDVYAMGARPITALAIVGFPEDEAPEILEAILEGGLAKMSEAGCTVAGGHSVRDEEMKFGYAVTGLVHPRKFHANSGARPGDALVLTKALGTGIVTTAAKNNRASQEEIEAASLSMVQLNRAAAEILHRFEVHAVTDITGFGLLGHAREVARASGVGLRFVAGALPLLPGALRHALTSQSKGLHSNREFAECDCNFAGDVDERLQVLMFDPQTSGGLLISIRADQAEEFVERLHAAGVAAAVIGSAGELAQPVINIVSGK